MVYRNYLFSLHSQFSNILECPHLLNFPNKPLMTLPIYSHSVLTHHSLSPRLGLFTLHIKHFRIFELSCFQLFIAVCAISPPPNWLLTQPWNFPFSSQSDPGVLTVVSQFCRKIPLLKCQWAGVKIPLSHRLWEQSSCIPLIISRFLLAYNS